MDIITTVNDRRIPIPTQMSFIHACHCTSVFSSGPDFGIESGIFHLNIDRCHAVTDHFNARDFASGSMSDEALDEHCRKGT